MPKPIIPALMLSAALFWPVAALAQTQAPAPAAAPAPADAPATSPATGPATATVTTTNKAGKSVPVDIEADSMEILDASNQAIFKGNVDAVKGGQKLHADMMTVTYEPVKQADGTSKSDVSTMDAKGGVTITTKSQVVTGDWAKMNVKANTLVVGGNVKVVQGKTVMTGQHLDVDLNTDRTVMSGGRAKASFVPK